MTNTIDMTEWLDFIEGEYLSSFIRAGGSAVKFAIAEEEKRTALRYALESRSRKQDYIFVMLNSAEMRAHMPQDIFFALASQIDWRKLSRRLILRLLAGRSYRIEGIDLSDTGNILDAVAKLNGVDSEYLLITDFRPLLTENVFSNRNIAKTFRVAMTHLCNADAVAQETFSAQPVIDWLTGTNTRIGAVRPFQIFTPINRTTARYFIESALTWVGEAGFSGTVVFLDNSRILLKRNPHDGKRYYTKAMVIDHYEVLREFIDEMDRMPRALLLAATDSDFVDDDHRARGWGIYSALKTRVMDDVRDRSVANPAAALVRIS